MVDDRQQGYALGASHFMTKPVGREALLAALRQHAQGGRGGSVLVVDDDPETREMVRRILEREGLRVTEAENGRVALEVVARDVPSLILLDLVMPEMDGFEFVLLLRQSPTGKDVPVVVLTSKDIDDDDRRRLSGGVQRILQKAAHGRETLLLEVRDLVRNGARATAERD
jgi:CheY-like chemotaxis protein